jgi:hypothetical protein
VTALGDRRVHIWVKVDTLQKRSQLNARNNLSRCDVTLINNLSRYDVTLFNNLSRCDATRPWSTSLQASVLGNPEIKSMCEKMLSGYAALDNCISLLKLGHATNAPSLIRAVSTALHELDSVAKSAVTPVTPVTLVASAPDHMLRPSRLSRLPRLSRLSLPSPTTCSGRINVSMTHFTSGQVRGLRKLAARLCHASRSLHVSTQPITPLAMFFAQSMPEISHTATYLNSTCRFCIRMGAWVLWSSTTL